MITALQWFYSGSRSTDTSHPMLYNTQMTIVLSRQKIRKHSSEATSRFSPQDCGHTHKHASGTSLIAAVELQEKPPSSFAVSLLSSTESASVNRSLAHSHAPSHYRSTSARSMSNRTGSTDSSTCAVQLPGTLPVHKMNGMQGKRATAKPGLNPHRAYASRFTAGPVPPRLLLVLCIFMCHLECFTWGYGSSERCGCAAVLWSSSVLPTISDVFLRDPENSPKHSEFFHQRGNNLWSSFCGRVWHAVADTDCCWRS